MLSISCPTINLQDTFLVLGEKRFHYIWLRDHCLCPQCYDPSSRQKISNFSDLTHDIKPFSVQCQDNQLLINWDELSGHQSIFPISWLLDHAYDPTPKPELSNQRILWDRGGLEAQKIAWPDYCADNHKPWRDLLDKLGFVVLRNVSIENLESLLLSIGPIYELAKFGNFSTVKPVPTSSNLSSDLSVSSEGHALSPHTDLTYLNAPPVVQIQYCVENDVSGGDSIIVDGLRLTTDFRKNHPDYFDILSNTPIKFKQLIARWNYFFYRKRPIIELNNKNEVNTIYFSHKNIEIDLSFEKTENFYKAFCTFTDYLNHPDYQTCYRLQKGDCLFIDNSQLLHGRKKFNSRSGTRHLEVAFIEWDYFHGLKNFQPASNN
jgi:gamma-butyrobetaine dioxygenase